MKNLSESLTRSQIYQDLMPDELMYEAFGTLRPSLSQKASYFFDKWRHSKSYAVKLHQGHYNAFTDSAIKDIVADFKRYCKQCGYKEMWDYQVKGVEARFYNDTDYAMVKLGWEGQNNG